LADDGDVYAYATNTFFMNVPTMVAYADGGGELAGDALPELPAWSEPDHVWAPSVTAVDDGYVLHYTTRHTASGRQCISVAVSDDPAGPFIDDSDEPLVCTLDLGGSIDPSTIEADGELWLLWKSDGNCCGIPTIIFAQPLSDDGTELAGDAVELIRNDLWWERDVVEGPSMIEIDGEFHLLYSANRWDTEAYAVGHAVCETVTGPCVKDPDPWLADTELTSGPGGLEVMELEGRAIDIVVYHGWTGDDVGYETGQRSLYVRPIRWVDGSPELIEAATGA
jgi:beta-xylosidase